MFELITVLAERHEVSLVVRVPVGDEASLNDVRSLCKEVYPVAYPRPARRSVFTIAGVIRSYYRLCRKADEIADREQFDSIHAEWTETGMFLKRRKTRMAIEAHDVLTKPMERRFRNAKGLRRFFFLFACRLTRAFELRVYAKFDRVFVLSEYDRKYLLSLSPSLDPRVLTYPGGAQGTARQFERKENSLLFLAAMDRGPNVEAALYFWNDVLPQVRREVPDVTFFIVGSRPLPEVRALAEKDGSTIVTGFVDDIEPWYRKATVFVAPLLTGGGIIVKILDALASGTPVVTTSVGNEGIGATPGEHLLIGDTSAEFARQVVRLLRSSALRESVGRAGKDFIAGRFSKDSLRKALQEYYPGE